MRYKRHFNSRLEHFEARIIPVKDHEITVAWKPGEFSVSADGKRVATSPRLKPLKIRLNPTALK